MRLSRPIYESLPLVYTAIGALGVAVYYLDPSGDGGKAAFVIGVCTEVAALTLFLRRLDYRALSREYSGEVIEL